MRLLSSPNTIGGVVSHTAWQCSLRAASSSNGATPVDHYQVLGVKHDATPKEIKSAYYELSKKHHPDINPHRKEQAAQMFTQVSESYEILSSNEKRRIYDRTRIPPSTRRAASTPSRAYTDLDLDYKHFEAFQRNARRKQPRRDEFVYEWPEEFSEGAKPFRRPRQFRSVFDEATERVAAHKDSRQVQREMEELRREMEREQERIAKRYPMPTFEQMTRSKRMKEEEEQRKYTVGLLCTMFVATFLFLVIKH